MTSSTPLIGFDRFIQLSWVETALRVRVGSSSIEDLKRELALAGLGDEAKIKTRTKLNGLCLEPRHDLAGFVERGVGLYQANNELHVVALAWGMAIASYPFFARVAEFVGRLTALQGDCSALEIHRRMSEIYGEREVTKRATQAVLQTQSNWGTIERAEKGKRVIRIASRAIDNDQVTAWLIEAAIHYIAKPVPVSALQSLPVLFPFTLSRSLAYVVSNSPSLDLRSEGPSNQFVALRAIN